MRVTTGETSWQPTENTRFLCSKNEHRPEFACDICHGPRSGVIFLRSRALFVEQRAGRHARQRSDFPTRNGSSVSGASRALHCVTQIAHRAMRPIARDRNDRVTNRPRDLSALHTACSTAGVIAGLGFHLRLGVRRRSRGRAARALVFPASASRRRRPIPARLTARPFIPSIAR